MNAGLLLVRAGGRRAVDRLPPAAALAELLAYGSLHVAYVARTGSGCIDTHLLCTLWARPEPVPDKNCHNVSN